MLAPPIDRSKAHGALNLTEHSRRGIEENLTDCFKLSIFILPLS